MTGIYSSIVNKKLQTSRLSEVMIWLYDDMIETLTAMRRHTNTYLKNETSAISMFEHFHMLITYYIN